MSISPEISCVLHIGLLWWDINYSGHTLCAYKIHIAGSETFKKGLFCENS